MRSLILALGIGAAAAVAGCGSDEGPAETGAGGSEIPALSGPPTRGPSEPALLETEDRPAAQASPQEDDAGAAGGGGAPSPPEQSAAGGGGAPSPPEQSAAGGGGAPSPPELSAAGTVVDPDPGWEEELESSPVGFSAYSWDTDFSRHTVPFDEIFSGGVPRDGIPPIYAPAHVGVEESDGWLEEQEPVVYVEIAGDARAYPLQILTWHEIVNDTVGGVPVAVTFCPLCNSAVAFDRRLDGVVHTFGVSGNLRNSDLIMWDHETQTWWQQLTGEAIVGGLAGRRLSVLPAHIVSYGDFRAARPDGLVLSRETGHVRPYGSNPYAGYDRVDKPPFLFTGDLDGRLLPKERVAAVTLDGVDLAFPYSALRKEGAVNHAVGGVGLVVFYKPGTVSALDGRSIPDSRDVGSTAVYRSGLDGRALTFRADGGVFVDDQTGSRWNILGEAVGGPLAGSRLRPIASADHFWFAWAAFKPDTVIYRGGAGD